MTQTGYVADVGRRRVNKVGWKVAVMGKIDTLLAMLQVYRYRITINNNNIGSIHNIDIRRYVTKKVLWWELYEEKRIDYWTIDLPRNCDILIERLEKLLKEAEDNYGS